jgi:hypothetical protein
MGREGVPPQLLAKGISYVTKTGLYIQAYRCPKCELVERYGDMRDQNLLNI